MMRPDTAIEGDAANIWDGEDVATRPSLDECRTRSRSSTLDYTQEDGLRGAAFCRYEHEVLQPEQGPDTDQEDDDFDLTRSRTRTSSSDEMSRGVGEDTANGIIINNNIVINNNNLINHNGGLLGNNAGRERKNSRKETLRRKFSGNSIVSFVNTLCKGNSSKLAVSAAAATGTATQADRIDEKPKQGHEECTPGHVITTPAKTRKSSRNSTIRARKKSAVLDGKDFSLHLAAVNGDLELVRKLIGQGHCLQTEDSVRRTPLEYAVLGGSFDCAALLIESGADVAKIKNGIH